MPGSLQNERMYRALRRRGYSKEAAARISNAKTPGHTVKASAVAPEVVSPTGPGGLFSAAGLGSVASRRKRLRRLKAESANYGGKVGERIIGNLARGEGGKFAAADSAGGGGAAKPKPKPKPKQQPAEKMTPQERANQNRAAVAQSTGLGSDLDGAMSRLEAGMGGQGDEKKADALVAQGLAKKDPNTGRYSLSPEGRRYFAAAKRGDAGAARAAMGDATDAVAGRQAREAERQAREADRAKRQGEREAARADREKKRSERQALLEKKRAEREKKRRDAEKKKRSGSKPRPAPAPAPSPRPAPPTFGRTESGAMLLPLFRVLRGGKTFTVFKDAGGQDRWASISSTAYRDRDGEIVSSEALASAVALADLTGRRGPLRFWHVPGADIGDCDYQALAADGRFLIESGTFRRPEYARALKEAPGYQMSIGFLHPDSEPDAAGVFHHISIFERSLVPPGRAANTLTRITTKEAGMLSQEKLKALQELLGRDGAAALLASVQATDKEAQARGVAYKEAPAAPEEITINGVTYTLKAPMPPPEMMEAGATEMADGAMEEEAEAEGDNDGPILGPADIEMIAAAVVSKLMAAMDEASSKRAAFDEEMKAMGYARMKEATDALAPKLDALTRVLGQYVDDLPAGAGARASQGSPAGADDPLVAQAMKHAGAAPQTPPASPEEAILRWVERNNGGVLPWDVSARGALPEGVNPAQHQAPGTR